MLNKDPNMILRFMKRACVLHCNDNTNFNSLRDSSMVLMSEHRMLSIEPVLKDSGGFFFRIRSSSEDRHELNLEWNMGMLNALLVTRDFVNTSILDTIDSLERLFKSPDMPGVCYIFVGKRRSCKAREILIIFKRHWSLISIGVNNTSSFYPPAYRMSAYMDIKLCKGAFADVESKWATGPSFVDWECHLSPRNNPLDKFLTFAMSQHKRIGRRSLARHLNSDILKVIFDALGVIAIKGTKMHLSRLQTFVSSMA